MTTETKVEAVAWWVPNARTCQDGSWEEGPGYLKFSDETDGAERKYGTALYPQSALDALRGEVAENEGVIRVWHRRCEEAERRVAALSESLARTRDAIAAAPEHSFGVHYEGDDRPSWPIRDEILHSIDAALTKESP